MKKFVIFPQGTVRRRAKMFGENDRLLYCAITKQHITDQPCYLVISFPHNFPNCLVIKEVADKMGLDNTYAALIEDYKLAQKYKHWFKGD